MSPIILSDFAGVMDRKRQAAVGAAPSAVRRGVYDGGAGMSAAPTLSQTWAEFVLAMLKRNFASVKHIKPAASRQDSAELYVLATGFRGGASAA